MGHGPVPQVSHQALADELGTVRQIVTRLPKRFEQPGGLVVARERVTVLDAAALRSLTGGPR